MPPFCRAVPKPGQERSRAKAEGRYAEVCGSPTREEPPASGIQRSTNRQKPIGGATSIYNSMKPPNARYL